MPRFARIAGVLGAAPRKLLALPGNYEEQIYAAIVRRGDVCFDIGANQGDVALFLGRLAGASGLIVAFEPVLSTYQRLRRRIERRALLGAKILPVPTGLSDCERDAVMSIPNGDFGMASIADRSSWVSAQGCVRMEQARVHLTTLDAFIERTSLAPTFMKIDVEGAELLVLKGASALFESGKRPLMLIEVFAPWERAFGYRPWDLFGMLLSRGYEILFACPRGLVPHLPSASHPFPPQYEGGYNVIAFSSTLHRDRLESARRLLESERPSVRAMIPPPQPNRI
jgi:FkbM family methyltransferase